MASPRNKEVLTQKSKLSLKFYSKWFTLVNDCGALTSFNLLNSIYKLQKQHIVRRKTFHYISLLNQVYPLFPTVCPKKEDSV